MGFTAKIDDLTNALNVWVRKQLVAYGEKENIRKKSKLIKKVSLTSEQELEIQNFFIKYYGKKISTDWHRLYQSYTGRYHFDYYPEILFSTMLEPKLNPYREAGILEDKNLLTIFFSDVEGLHIPKTYVSCVKGVLRDGNDNLISFDTAVDIVKQLPDFVIKKTRGTSSGRDVYIAKTGENAEKILRSGGENFVVQEKIIQSGILKKLNPSSVNTFRVITYICENRVCVCPVALRMGRANADRDNMHYGGICIGVDVENEALKKTAYSEFGDSYDEHPDTKTVFDGYKVPAGKVIATAKLLHRKIPFLGILSWDLSLDTEGNVVLIEMNCSGQSAWFCQMVNGEPLFGDNTKQMLSIIKR